MRPVPRKKVVDIAVADIVVAVVTVVGIAGRFL
jgi:hypothetical protein